MISDYSKIPPIIYESAGIIRSDDYNNSNDSVYLKKKLNSFENIEDVFQAYNAYMFFYHNLRPNGSLNYMTPSEFSRIFSDDNNCFNSKTIFVKK